MCVLRFLVCAATALALLLPASAPAELVHVAGRTLSIAPVRGRLASLALPAVKRTQAVPAASLQPCPNASAPCLTYHGGPVMRTNTTHAVFWGQPASFPTGYESLIDRFMTDVAHDSGALTNVYSVHEQYYDTVGGAINHAAYSSTFGGTSDDTAPYPPASPSASCVDPLSPSRTCITDAQIQHELTTIIVHGALATGYRNVYFLMLPPGVDVCTGPGVQNATSNPCSGTDFCGYHSSYGPLASETVYAVLPDSGDPAVDPGCDNQTTSTSGPQRPNGVAAAVDPTINVISHEHIEAITDPSLPSAAWFDGASGDEIADLCATDFGSLTGPSGAQTNAVINGHAYLLQSEYDNLVSACGQHTQAAPPTAAFTPPGGLRPPNTPIAFDARTSTDPNGESLTYGWTFGDGASAAGAQPTHSYSSPGAYTVTLTVTDAAGLTNSTTRAVLIGAPHAVIALTPSGPITPTQTVSFDGRGSTDPNGEALTYAWSFGDGASAVGAQPTHAYALPGSYVVSLVVTDSDGASGQTSQPLTVTSSQPTGTPPSGTPPSDTGSPPSGGAAAPPTPASPTPASSTPLSPASTRLGGTLSIGRRSLRSLLRGGLALTVVLNRPATATCELLLGATTARALHLHRRVVTVAGRPYVVLRGVAVAAGGTTLRVRLRLNQGDLARLRRVRRLALVVEVSLRGRDGRLAVLRTARIFT